MIKCKVGDLLSYEGRNPERDINDPMYVSKIENGRIYYTGGGFHMADDESLIMVKALDAPKEEDWKVGDFVSCDQCYIATSFRGKTAVFTSHKADGWCDIGYPCGMTQMVKTSDLTRAADAKEEKPDFKEGKPLLELLKDKIVYDEPKPTPGYLPSSTGSDLLWPNVRATTLAENKPIPPSDRAANECSRTIGVNSTMQAKYELGRAVRFFPETNNADRRAMIENLKNVQKLSTELIKRIEGSL